MTSLVATACRGAPSGRLYRDVTWPLISSIASLKNEVVRATIEGIANAIDSLSYQSDSHILLSFVEDSSQLGKQA